MSPEETGPPSADTVSASAIHSVSATVTDVPGLQDHVVGADASPSAGPLQIMAVLVLYRCTPADSACWVSLRTQVDGLPPHLAFRLLLCENEAVPEHRTQFPGWVEYLPRDENAGLAWAYNAGLERARQSGAAWLLTLDQDTVLPADFLRQIFARAAALAGREEIAAIVPELMSAGGEVYSPFVAKAGYESALPAGFKGVARGEVRAFNSGALLRVQWLLQNGGYDPLFWLDFLDHVLFRAIGKSGARVWVAGDIRLEHHLSLAEDRSSMSELRFRDFLEAESASLDLYGTRTEGWLHTLRLAGRLLNQRRRRDAARFTRPTWQLLQRRLRLSRPKRIAAWRQRLLHEKPWMFETQQSAKQMAAARATAERGSVAHAVPSKTDEPVAR